MTVTENTGIDALLWHLRVRPVEAEPVGMVVTLDRRESFGGLVHFLHASTDVTVVGRRRSTPVVGGVTDACRAAGVALYGGVVHQTVPVSSPRAAEIAKLLENIYRCVNIGLVNEL